MSTLVQDFRYGIRMLTKTPVVSAVAALSLALGIAATASIFAILNSFLFEPLPYADQESLVLFREGAVGEGIEMFGGASVGSFRDYEAASAIEAGTIYTLEPGNLTGLDVPEQLSLVVGTPNLFEVLGVQPTRGRGFRPEEGTEGLGNVLVLEYDFWQRRFLGDPEILGRTLTVDGTSYTVIGVMPEAFDMIPANVDAFRPTDFADRRDDYAGRGYISFARVAPGATTSQVQAAVDAAWSDIEVGHPDATRGMEPRVIRAREFFPGPTDKKLILLLTAVTLFGLLIACANVANLLLGRAEERQREVAVRTALGAGRHRILRQLLTESVTLGAVAGAIGIVLSIGIVGWIRGAMPVEMPKAMHPQLDPEVLVATVIMSILAGIAFGMAPALHAARGELRESLGEGSRGGTASRSRKRIRNFFVIGEFAVALALLTGSGFLMEAFNSVMLADPGFRQEGLLTFTVSAEDGRYPESEDLRVYHDELIASLGGIPGIEGIAVMNSLPRGQGGNPTRSYRIEGRTLPEGVEEPTAMFQVVNPGYFSTLEVPILHGRGIEPSDREDTRPVVVVSESFARREFEDPASALGEQLWIGDAEESRTIVGVSRTILQERIPLAGSQGELMYVPLAQLPLRVPSFALRFPGDPRTATADVREAIWAVNPDQPLGQIQTLDAWVATSLSGPRVLSIFLGAMGGIALLLAAMGIYGVMAHAVTQQQREIGIRMALGAAPGRVVGMVTRSGLSLVGIGMFLGLPLSFLMYRLAATTLNLFEAELGTSYAIWVTVALAVIATVSTLLPARRATGVHPVAALKE